MSDLSKEVWYHGDLSRVAAEERLLYEPSGTFLFRESESRPAYVLSVKAADKTKHFVVSRMGENHGVQIVGKTYTFENLQALVDFYSKAPPSTTDGVCLVRPCVAKEEDSDEEPDGHYVELEQQAVNENALREAQAAFARRKEQSETHRRASDFDVTVNTTPRPRNSGYEDVQLR